MTAVILSVEALTSAAAGCCALATVICCGKLRLENVPYVQKCIRYIMYTNQICIAPPKNSGEKLFFLCSTVHNMFLLAKG